MDSTELIYNEYKRLVERYDQLLDSSFSDIKLYGILGPFLMGSSPILQSPKFDLIQDTETLFAILLLLVFLIAIIAFRDLLKQSYLQQLGFNIRKSETYLRNKILNDSEAKEFEIFCLRKSWVEKYYNVTKISYSGFLLVFLLTITVIPTLLLWPKSPFLAIILLCITTILLIFHTILSNVIFKKTNNYEA